MCEQGILLKQEVISIDNERQNYTVGITQQSPNGRQKSEILSKVMIRFTWVDAETGEKDENLFGANGQNDWDKGVGSALTYAERYFLLKYFHIATDEDDIDAKISDEITETPLQIAIQGIRSINSLEDLQAYWTVNKKFQQEKAFIESKDNRKKQLQDNKKQNNA